MVGVSYLRVESVTIIAFAICIFLSFYFTFLSFQAIDDTLKKQLVTLAASFLITGVILFACMTIYLGIKKAFVRVDDQLRNSEESSKCDENQTWARSRKEIWFSCDFKSDNKEIVG
jgi:NADH:ubiquinone oxidoreductase subunit 6 (subunit J)